MSSAYTELTRDQLIVLLLSRDSQIAAMQADREKYLQLSRINRRLRVELSALRELVPEEHTSFYGGPGRHPGKRETCTICPKPEEATG